MPDVRPDPKPVSEGGIGRRKPDRGNRRRGRKMATRDEWLRLREVKLTGCRVCLFTYRDAEPLFPPLELHHLVPRSLGGDDVEDNLIGLCQGHHRHVTAREDATLFAVAATLTDAEYAYIIGKLGEGGPERLFGVGR